MVGPILPVHAAATQRGRRGHHDIVRHDRPGVVDRVLAARAAADDRRRRTAAGRRLLGAEEETASTAEEAEDDDADHQKEADGQSAGDDPD